MELERVPTSIIKVVGIGGGGCNAVNHMFRQGIRGVDFVVCNTDLQSLEASPVMNKVQLGKNLTQGLGAGNDPASGRNAALESIEDIKAIFQDGTRMVFLTAGMGGGTGTGAAPVIAKLAKELDILTVAIVTLPFSFEGRKRKQQAQEGIAELKEHVDSLIVICNDRLRTLYGNLPISEAFAHADNVLTTAAKGIAEIITCTGYINVDFEDVKAVMKNSGVAIMGIGIAEGENRALRAAQEALSSPLLNDNRIYGAKNILLHITSGTQEITMDELTEITDYIQNEAGDETNIIWGNSFDKALENKVSVILVAAGFDTSKSKPDIGVSFNETTKRKTYVLDVADMQGKSQSLTINELKNVRVEQSGRKNTSVKVHTLDDEQLPNEQLVIPDLEKNNTNEYNEDDVIFKMKKVTQGSKDEEIDKKNIINMLHLTNEKIEMAGQINIKIRTIEGIEELEQKPAYLRRRVLDNLKTGDRSELSDKVITGNSQNISIQRRGNSFLHDNVD